MNNFIREQRSDIRLLNSVKAVAERGDFEAVSELMEKRGVDRSLSNTVEELWIKAVGEYVKDHTGGSVVSTGVRFNRDILDKEDFGKNYWGRLIGEEIQRKSSLIVEQECRALSMVCC